MLLFVGLLSLAAVGLVYVALNIAREHRRQAESKTRLRQAEESKSLSGHEKRKHPRINTVVEVDFAHGERFYSGMINNISAGGAFIETDADLNSGDTIALSYPEPDAAGQIKRIAKVIRITGGGVAVAFMPSSEDTDD